MIDRVIFTVLFLFVTAMTLGLCALGGLSLYVATLKHAWMLEHNMISHAYALAFICTVGEVWGLFVVRRGIIHAYEAFVQIFRVKNNESVRS